MASMALDFYWELIQKGFAPRDNAAIAYAMMLRESSGDPSAIRDTRGRTDLPRGLIPELSVGLFQINLLAHPDAGSIADMQNPVKNINYAVGLYKQQGWEPWTMGRYPLPAPIYGPGDIKTSNPPKPVGLLVAAALVVVWLSSR